MFGLRELPDAPGATMRIMIAIAENNEKMIFGDLGSNFPTPILQTVQSLSVCPC